MGHRLSTTSCLQSTEIIDQGRTCGVFQRQNRHIVSIHILDDDSLLNVFNLYRPSFLGEKGLDLPYGGNKSWVQGRWWYRLAHVCQRWRNLIIGSASYLHLSLVCANGTPVEDMLAHSPPLPLTVDYLGGGITAEDERGILLALRQRHRIRHLRLGFPDQILRKLVMAIDEEFPTLEYLILSTSPEEGPVLVLPETLQAPNLCHLALRGFACSIRPQLHPTTPSLVTLFLMINRQSAYFQPNIMLQWISFMPQLEDLDIVFTFPILNRDVERHLSHTPITTHITLPNLRYFAFRGVNAYMEAVVCRITAPRLKTLRMQLYNQPTISIPRLAQFMNATDSLRFDSAEIMFKDKSINLGTLFPESGMYVILVIVECRHLDWQVSSAVQISNALSQVVSAVEHLTLRHEIHSQSSEEHNHVDRIEWRSLLRSFSNVKTLRVEGGLVEELSHFLRLEDGELPLGLLPELQELTYFGSREDNDPFTSFIDARLEEGRPVTLIRQSTSPIPSPLSSIPPAIALPSYEAGNRIET